MTEKHQFIANGELVGQRLDKALAVLFPDYSRTLLKHNIKAGRVRHADGTVLKPAHVLTAGEAFVFEPEPRQPDDTLVARFIPLNIVYEDDVILIVDKPPGLVAHPAAGHHDDTLVNSLIAHHDTLRGLPRAGLIHRLDKDTGGLLAVAKTESAYQSLTAQMQARQVRREYLCLVCSALVSGGRIEAPIGRHPRNRKRMAVVPRSRYGRHAVTHYRILERFSRHTLLNVILETGRTHQIRVHMNHIDSPVFGDAVYGGRFRPPPDISEEQLTVLSAFRRQALHACRLAFTHPARDETVSYQSPLPDDFAAVLKILRGADGL